MALVDSLFADPISRERFHYTCNQVAFFSVAILAYLFGGAALFYLVESGAYNLFIDVSVTTLERERARLLEVLWAETIARSEDDWAQIANAKLDQYEQVVRTMENAGVAYDDFDYGGGGRMKWSPINSLFYCYTVITTIGYGNICPKTWLGKLLTVPYGLVGVPLMLLYLSEIGKALTLVLKAALRKRWPDEFDTGPDFNFTATLSILITLSYMLIGAIIFDLLMPTWSLIDSAWFSFATLSTIGFGDFTPNGSATMMLVVIGYSITALSLFAMCINNIQGVVERYLADKRRWWEMAMDYWRRYIANNDRGSGVHQQPWRQRIDAADEGEAIDGDSSPSPTMKRKWSGTTAGANSQHRTIVEEEEEEEEEEVQPDDGEYEIEDVDD